VGIGLDTTIEFLRGAAVISQGTTAKYLRGAAGIRLVTTIQYLRLSTSAAAKSGLGTTAKYLVSHNAGSGNNRANAHAKEFC
jgi:hypothetical protein